MIVGAYSHVTIAQTDETVSVTSSDTIISKKLESFEQRLNQQEDEITALKKEKVSLKNQLQKNKSVPSARPASRKVTISRQGSKQVTVE